MFLDRVKIEVKAGKGGNGAVSFRRERYMPKGGPDGGKGGDGGSVILVADSHMTTLLDYRYKPKIKAENGGAGSGNNRTGRNGKDAKLRVPCGTLVYDENRKLLGDLVKAGEELIIAGGGRGGRGNSSYATPTNRTPRIAKEGQPGESRTITLELKLIADVGLVGLPNAGKSTLLSRVSQAKPEIADYPFTTLKPNLGMVRVNQSDSFVMADIPGLIAGASEGKGLGHQFLRHIERTRVLVFLIDSLDPEPEETYQILMNEVEQFNPALAHRPRLIVSTKADLGEEPWEKADLFISSVTGKNMNRLIQQIFTMVEAEKLAD